MKKLAFGIDLGTTNSCIAVQLPGRESSTVIPVLGSKIIPSCVKYNTDGTTTVGHTAYLQRHKDDVVYSAKRFMGTNKIFEVKLEDGTTKSVTPVDVATEVLKHIVTHVPPSYGKVEDVVITVPAYFNSEQRKATAEAGKRAGLNVLRIINEPTAAALTYGVNHKNENNIIRSMIIDVGGGTTDITIMEFGYVPKVHTMLNGIIEKGYNFKTVSTGGDNFLGGDDFDKNIFEIFKKEAIQCFPDLTPEHFEENEKVYIKELEVLKKNLLGQVAMGVSPDALAAQVVIYDENVDDRLKARYVTLTINDFVDAFYPFFENIKECINECRRNPETDELSEMPDKCILVGGSTKNPFFNLLLKQMYNEEMGDDIDLIIPSNEFADESVAQGAALYASACLNPEESSIRIKEVNPIPVGVGYWDNTFQEERMAIIVNKDEILPVSHSKYYETLYDNQETINFPIYQGTSPSVRFNTLLGNLEIKDIEPAPAGKEVVGVNFFIDINGIISVEGIYKDKKYSLTLDSVLGVDAKSISPMDKLLLQRVEKALEYYNYVEDEAKISILQNYGVGDKLPDFVLADTKLINEYHISKIQSQLAEDLADIEESSSSDSSDETSLFTSGDSDV